MEEEQVPENQEAAVQDTTVQDATVQDATADFSSPSLAERLEAQRMVAVNESPICPWCGAQPLQFKRFEMQVENMLASIFACANCNRVVPVQILQIMEPVIKPSPESLKNMIIRGAR